MLTEDLKMKCDCKTCFSFALSIQKVLAKKHGSCQLHPTLFTQFHIMWLFLLFFCIKHDLNMKDFTDDNETKTLKALNKILTQEYQMSSELRKNIGTVV